MGLTHVAEPVVSMQGYEVHYEARLKVEVQV